ncbi:ROK family glucokinase [Janibacter cremeus]|uniref:ROK family glucokinase n=1 Tax=Janibacter cremeus TaxID=1285192 RepID=UPI0023F63A10|nr:ROK family glucokinase [Janibacter cremeus]WEV78941.1 ROK family glucokinase [Janibacter cremeus]
MSTRIGIDIGGTKVSGGVLDDDDGRILVRTRRDTPDRSNAPRIVEDTIVEVFEELLVLAEEAGLERPATVGVGAAGFVAADRATVVFAPHLSWRNEPLRESLGKRIDLPIVIENDANAALWAEHRFGAARGATHAVMITLGTGIGGALLVGGHLVRGRYGIAGEFGHMQVVPGGQRCECGNRGCWEQYSSGNALVREARGMAMANSPMAADLIAHVGGDVEDLTGPRITDAAKEGDATAVELLAEIGHWLGVGIADLAAALDPEVFIVGGGVSAAEDLLLGPARDTFARQLAGRGYRPAARIVTARFGPDAGLIGAATLGAEEA